MSRGTAKYLGDDLAGAIADYYKTIELEPGQASAYENLASLLATSPDPQFRDAMKAIEYARRACELTNWQDPGRLETLAAAHAESGAFEEAMKWRNKALGFSDNAAATRDAR